MKVSFDIMVVGAVAIVGALNVHDELLSVLILPLPFGPALISLLDIFITSSKILHAESSLLILQSQESFFVWKDHTKSAIPQNPRKSVRVGTGS